MMEYALYYEVFKQSETIHVTHHKVQLFCLNKFLEEQEEGNQTHKEDL